MTIKKKSFSKKQTKTKNTTANSQSLFPSQAEKKRCYDLVTTDLWQQLKKAENNQRIRFGNLGSFVKTQHKIKSAILDNKTYLYDKISFRLFDSKKQELDQ
jgi:hypothetical protein